MVAGAIHIHVAQRDVIENTSAGNARAVGRIAGTVSARSVFRGCELVVSGIGIALARADPLVHQRLNAGHDGRRERRASRTGPVAWRPAARRSAISGIRPAENVVVAPEAVSGKERNVRSVPYAVLGVAQDGLP